MYLGSSIFDVHKKIGIFRHPSTCVHMSLTPPQSRIKLLEALFRNKLVAPSKPNPIFTTQNFFLVTFC